jgi:RNA binding exosome subunit
MIIYYPDILHNITLTVFEANGQLGKPIVINNVKFIRNHITKLIGTVFNKTGNNDNNFQISINTGWDTSTIGF